MTDSKIPPYCGCWTDSLWGAVDRGAGCGRGALLLTQLFFKFGKLMHGDLLLLVHDLLNTLDLLDLEWHAMLVKRSGWETQGSDGILREGKLT